MAIMRKRGYHFGATKAIASFFIFSDWQADRPRQIGHSPCRLQAQRKSQANRHGSSGSALVGEGGFEPPKSLTTDLQSAPFGHSGIPPYSVRCAAGIGAGRRTRTPDLLITKVCVYVHQIQFILSSPNMPSVRIASRAIKPCSINGSFARWRQNSDSSRNRPRVRDAHGGAVNSSL